MDSRHVSLAVLVILTLAVSLAFLAMIRPFLMALLLAAIVASLLQAGCGRLTSRIGGRRRLAAVLTIVMVLLVVILPLIAAIGLVTAQAIGVAESVTPWAQQMIDQPDRLGDWFRDLPGAGHLLPYEDQILLRAADIVSWLSRWAVENLSAATTGTLNFLFLLFIGLYALYYFLLHGKALLDRALWYVPLADEDERRLVERFRSVARATLMGTLVVGLVQGLLAGAALAVAGVPGFAFWALLMVVLSVIPGVGTALVWLPASGWLFYEGERAAAIAVVIFCGAVVGSVDNLLRPRLVGRDTAMPDLLILLSTLGGIGMFGVIGLVIGPVLAAVFLTLWDLYGVAFSSFLPAGRGSDASRSRGGSS